MPRKKLGNEAKSEAVQSEGPQNYQILNLTQNVFPVPYFNDEGKLDHLQLRLQGRGGQKPPVIPSTAITDGMRNLEKRRFIRLVKVAG